LTASKYVIKTNIMAKNKEYSLCISVQKLAELKAGHTRSVSHRCTPRWIGFYKKNPRTVRFFEQRFFESAIFEVRGIIKHDCSEGPRIEIKIQ